MGEPGQNLSHAKAHSHISKTRNVLGAQRRSRAFYGKFKIESFLGRSRTGLRVFMGRVRVRDLKKNKRGFVEVALTERGW